MTPAERALHGTVDQDQDDGKTTRQSAERLGKVRKAVTRGKAVRGALSEPRRLTAARGPGAVPGGGPRLLEPPFALSGRRWIAPSACSVALVVSRYVQDCTNILRAK